MDLNASSKYCVAVGIVTLSCYISTIPMHIDLCRINVFSNVKPNWNASLVWSIDPFIIVFYNQFMKGWNHSTRKKTKLFLLMCMVNQKWQQSSLFLRHGQTMQYWEAVSSLGHKLSLPSKNHFQFRCSVAHIECRPYICTLIALYSLSCEDTKRIGFYGYLLSNWYVTSNRCSGLMVSSPKKNK